MAKHIESIELGATVGRIVATVIAEQHISWAAIELERTEAAARQLALVDDIQAAAWVTARIASRLLQVVEHIFSIVGSSEPFALLVRLAGIF